MRRQDVTSIAGTDACAAWLYPPAGGRADGTFPLIALAAAGRPRDRRRDQPGAVPRPLSTS
jgi:hypothetical protein